MPIELITNLVFMNTESQIHNCTSAYLAKASIALVWLNVDLRCISVDLCKSITYEHRYVQIHIWPVGYVRSKGQRRRPISQY
jgi:hypothetical protein